MASIVDSNANADADIFAGLESSITTTQIKPIIANLIKPFNVNEGYYLSFDPNKITEPPKKRQYVNSTKITIQVKKGLTPKDIYLKITNVLVNEMCIFHIFNPNLWRFCAMFHSNSQKMEFLICVEKSKNAYRVIISETANGFIISEDARVLKALLENKLQENQNNQVRYSRTIITPISSSRLIILDVDNYIKDLINDYYPLQNKRELVEFLKSNIQTLIDMNCVEHVCQIFCRILKQTSDAELIHQMLDFFLSVFTESHFVKYFQPDLFQNLFDSFKEILKKFPVNTISLESIDLHWLITLLIESVQPNMTLDAIKITADLITSKSLIVKRAAESTWVTIYSPLKY